MSNHRKKLIVANEKSYRAIEILQSVYGNLDEEPNTSKSPKRKHANLKCALGPICERFWLPAGSDVRL